MRFIPFFVFLVFWNNGFSQIRMLNLSLIKPDTALAYRFQENRITFQGIKLNRSYQLKNSEQKFQKFSNDTVFLYKPVKIQKWDTLYLYKNRKLIESFVIGLENLAPAKVYLGSIRDSLVTVDEILQNNELILSHEPQLFKPCSRVLSFTFQLICKNTNDTTAYPISLHPETEAFWNNYQDSILDLDLSFEQTQTELSKIDFYSEVAGFSFSDLGIRLLSELSPGDKLRLEFAKISCSSCIQRTYFIDKTFTIKP